MPLRALGLSAGQLVVTPLQVSVASHAPVEGRQGVPAPTTSATQVPDRHVSCASHTPLAAPPQGVPLVASWSAGHIVLPATHTSGVSQSGCPPHGT
ncbi:MAG: hypothetical protein IPI43_27460 [Sandaracinaceae bacterium]|nr:hypothetical protein [Sandaracinaceae bacterium]